MLNIDVSHEPNPSGAKRLFHWMRRHWVLSILALLFLWVLLEVAFLPFGEITKLKSANPVGTAFMRLHQERAQEEGTSFTRKYQWIPIGRMPSHLVNAVVVSEDGTFWSHEGFDWFEFRASFERNISEGRISRGASTITQQLVKNLFLSPSKNPLRKMKEWILTWRMEQVLGKSRIMELYLNVIEWGGGVYGAEAASRYYFGKSASLLSREEAARLAAIIPNPRRYRADGDSRYVSHRARVILTRMAARGL
ncbi:MAG: monofunctional biosynthetic peptidoglycan transglycosylase [Bacteroidota bacterium]